MFTFLTFQHWHFDNILYLPVFKATLFSSNFTICSFKINMKNSAKYLQSINILLLTLAEKTEIKNLGHETPELIISQSSASRKQTYVRKFNPAIYMFNVSG
jgi:hypothetical protein